MAPEVISDGYADPRSDLYSLGVVLFEAATGRLPFSRRLALPADAPAPDAAPARPHPGARAAAGDRRGHRPGAGEGSARPLRERRGSGARSGEVRRRRRGGVGPRAPRPARRARVCRHCGGALVERCGLRRLRRARCCAASSVRRRRAVLVTGPGEPGGEDRRPEARGPGQAAGGAARGRRPRSRAGAPSRPVFPFMSPRGSPACPPLRWWIGSGVSGLDACIAPADWPLRLARQAIRSKVWQTTCRPLAGIRPRDHAFVSACSPRSWGLLGLLAPFLLIAARGRSDVRGGADPGAGARS